MSPLDLLIKRLAKLPGFGPRSARRAVLFLLKHRESALQPLIDALMRARDDVKECSVCGNLGGSDPCEICCDPGRDRSQICVVEDVADLWALERSSAYRGLYQILGGTLSALDGVTPKDLPIVDLVERVKANDVKEVILALNVTVEGQATAHYVAESLVPTGVLVSKLAHGVPVGGELDYLDEGTLMAALKARRKAP